jgi:hypothetical protein
MKSIILGIPQTLFHPILMFTAAVMLATLVFVMPLARGGGQQGKERAVKITTFKDQPVEIVAVKVKGVPVELDKKFVGDNDWFNGMTATIKNVSDKPVIYVTVSVTAYYEKDGVRKRTSDGRDRRAAVDFGYGLRPRLPGESTRSYSAAPLMPGQTTDLVFSGIHRDQLNGLLSREDASTDIPELILWVDHVAWYKEDEEMWIRGAMYRLDPTNPGRWIPKDDPDSPLSRLNHAFRKPKLDLERLAV